MEKLKGRSGMVIVYSSEVVIHHRVKRETVWKGKGKILYNEVNWQSKRKTLEVEIKGKMAEENNRKALRTEEDGSKEDKGTAVTRCGDCVQ